MGTLKNEKKKVIKEITVKVLLVAVVSVTIGILSAREAGVVTGSAIGSMLFILGMHDLIFLLKARQEKLEKQAKEFSFDDWK